MVQAQHETNESDYSGVEGLFHKIFYLRKYNNLVRPFDKKTGLTNVVTELKLLQIDLVYIKLGT